MGDYTKAIRFLVESIEIAAGFGDSDDKTRQDKEAELAHAFSKAMQGDYFKTWNGHFMCYSGKRWVRVRVSEDLPKIIYEVLRKKGVGKVYRMPASVGKILRVVQDDMNISSYSGSKRYISFKNCVLDLVTREKLDFSEKYESMVYLDFNYDPESECPLWDKTLKEIISDDASISVMYEFLGLIFVDRSALNVETMMFFVGSGSNGKGVIFEMMQNILGENQSSMSFDNLCTHNNSEYYRASVAGKLLNFCSDMGTKEFSNGIFKQIVSREPVICRFPSEKPFETRDMPLLAASINKMPVITDSTDGFWRRCQFLHFGRTFTGKEQDKTLKFRLRPEISGVFNRILQGMDRILKNQGNFTESQKILELGKTARIESNSVLSWCRENRYVGKAAIDEMLEKRELISEEYREIKMFSSDIMKSYTHFCTEYGHMAKSNRSLNEDLKSDGFIYKERMRLSGVDKVSSGFIFYEIIKPEVFLGVEEEKLINELPF